MMNPNLDAALPVGLGIPNHYLVADDYGYQAGTLYHHLNLGMYGGDFNVWYRLPVIDIDPGLTSIQGCWYNVYKSGSGEIICGRVTDPNGNPLCKAYVSAQYGIYSRNTFTNAQGIYAYPGIPGGTEGCTCHGAQVHNWRVGIAG
jgi:hypothetical protein